MRFRKSGDVFNVDDTDWSYIGSNRLVGEKIGPLLKELAPVCRGVAKDGCLRSINTGDGWL